MGSKILANEEPYIDGRDEKYEAGDIRLLPYKIAI